MADIIKFKRGTSSEWATLNPVLRLGEPGFEKNTGKLKIGDGTTAWNSLDYLTDAGGSAITFENVDDRVNDLLVAGSFIDLDYDDANDTLTISAINIGPSGHEHVVDDIIDFDSALSTSIVGNSGIAVNYNALSDELVISYTGVAGGLPSLDQITDVTLNIPLSGQVLKYNGSIWVNDTDSVGGGGSITSPLDVDNLRLEGNALSITSTSLPDLVLTPNVSGSLVLTNETSSGGNVVDGSRGYQTIDLQSLRAQPTQIVSGNYGSILGGAYHEIRSDYAVIGGGQANRIEEDAEQSFIAAGNANVIASGSLRSTIIGGDSNRAYGSNSTILGGRFSSTTLYGEIAHANLPLPSQTWGGNQHSMLIAATQTNSTTETELLLGKSESTGGYRIILPPKTAWHFDIKIIAHQSDFSSTAWWKYTGGIYRNLSDTVVLIDTTGAYKSIHFDSTGSVFSESDIFVDADDTNKALKITATASTTASIYWVAYIDIIQSRIA